jgi:hypothetical protein
VVVGSETVNRLSFALKWESGARYVEPVVDDRRLSIIVDEFERARGFAPAGGYSGLLASASDVVPIDQRFLGVALPGQRSDVKPQILGCECGESGCWPLLARVEIDGASITWTALEQPHRQERDYSELGFRFDRSHYYAALARLADEIGPQSLGQNDTRAS